MESLLYSHDLTEFGTIRTFARDFCGNPRETPEILCFLDTAISGVFLLARHARIFAQRVCHRSGKFLRRVVTYHTRNDFPIRMDEDDCRLTYSRTLKRGDS